MLSKKTKYGIKALTFLARQEDQTPVAIADIAKSENAEAVFFDNEIMGQQVGYLCGFKGFVRSEKEGEDTTDECLIFSGIDGRSLDPILKKLREKEGRRPGSAGQSPPGCRPRRR